MQTQDFSDFENSSSSSEDALGCRRLCVASTCSKIMSLTFSWPFAWSEQHLP